MREDILNLATEQLESGGYDNLSFAKIANALGTTRANIHHHFKDKEGLATEATQITVDRNLAASQQVADQHKGDLLGFLQAIEEQSIATVNCKGDNKTCVCSQLVLGSGIPVGLSEISKGYIRGVHELVENLVVESQAAGKINKKYEPAEMATHVVSIMLGMNQLAVVNSQHQDSSVWMKGLFTNWLDSYQ